MSQWSWKDPVEGSLPLRYEPGNWGDILKGEWLLHWMEERNTDFVYVDPFCGQPDYPLTEATRRRLEQCPAVLYRSHLGTELLSSASLVAAQARRKGLQVTLHTSDKEASPDLQATRECDLLLFDPYDFFENWPQWNDLLLEASRHRDVLIYLYNKSPRGASQFRQYQALRQRWQDRPLLVGRLAADALLPRAWHEVWLVGPGASHPPLRGRLKECTLALHDHLSRAGAWEE